MSNVLAILYAVIVVPMFGVLLACTALSSRISREELDAETA
ncbi:hypothetical protein [Deinococcus puniceus]|nr:hypothetical protein [Deinococcus puniceus]